MNWTGGRLHRHSKANADPRLKAQRQHFANARLRSRHPQQSKKSLLTLSIFGATIRPGPSNSVSQDHPTRVTDLEAEPSYGGNNPQYSRSPTEKRTVLNLGKEQTFEHKESQVQPPKPASADQSPYFKQPADTRAQSVLGAAKSGGNSLQDVKLKLLKRPDWTGLAITKPPVMKLAYQNEMENFGRRRRLTRIERGNRPEGQTKTAKRENEVRRVLRRRLQDRATVISNEEISLRDGSRIHQTQTTCEAQSLQGLAPRKSESIASTSMILDRFEAQQRDKRASHREVTHTTSPVYLADDDSIEEPANVIPLSRALDLRSFDEVIERSCSMSRSQSRSHNATKFVDPGNLQRRSAPSSSQRLSISGEETGKLSWSNTNQHGPECGFQSPDKVQRLDGSSSLTTPRGTDGGNIRQASTRDGDVCRPTPRDQASQPLRSTAHYPIGIVPRYTLDEQVRWEKTASQQDINEDLDRQQASVDLVETLATEANSMRSHRTQEESSVQDLLPYSLPYQKDAASVHGSMQQRSEEHSSGGTRTSSMTTSRIRQSGRTGLDASQRQLTQLHEINSNSPPRLRTRYLAAKQEVLSNNSSPETDQHNDTYNRLSDENEAWMKYVFPKDFPRIQQGFSFGPSQSPPKTRSDKPEAMLEWSSRPKALGTSSYNTVGNTPSAHSPAKTFLTNGNTSIFVPEQQTSTHSDTDFMSQMSPMEGLLDERLVDTSMYNNPAKSERSFVKAPLILNRHLPRSPIWNIPASTGKRTASRAFGPTDEYL